MKTINLTDAPITRSKSGYAVVRLEGKIHFVTPYDDFFVIRANTGNMVTDAQRQPLKFISESDATKYANQNAKNRTRATITKGE